MIYLMSQTDVLTRVLHSLVEGLGSPLRAVELKSPDCLNICVVGILSFGEARVGYSSIQRNGVNISVIEEVREKDCSSEESLE